MALKSSADLHSIGLFCIAGVDLLDHPSRIGGMLQIQIRNFLVKRFRNCAVPSIERRIGLFQPIQLVDMVLNVLNSVCGLVAKIRGSIWGFRYPLELGLGSRPIASPIVFLSLRVKIVR